VPVSAIRVTELKTEHLSDALGIQTPRPRFRWILQSTERGQLQRAYQVQVATSKETLEAGVGDLWDSGRVEADNSVEVPYAGRELKSGQRAFWRVRVWGRDGGSSAHSEPTFFEMGLRDADDWKGRWIAATRGISSPIFRRNFSIDSPIRRARVYVSGLGYYHLYVNGEKVGDRVLDPASSYYHNDQSLKLHPRVLYATYDVTDILRNGVNTIGVMLGHGWYSADPDRLGFRVPYGDRPRVILQLNIELGDGRKASIVSDASWKASSGPIVYNDLAHGETYDARLEQPGWCAAGFDDSSWEPALLVEAPNGGLTAQLLPPSQIMETLPVARVVTPNGTTGGGVSIYDFGQNFTGWVRLAVSGPRDTKLFLTYGSRLYPEDNTLDNRSNDYHLPMNASRQTDVYILKGEGTEIWEPRFTLHGFRYVEIRALGATTEPLVRAVEGRFVRSAVEASGSFSSSNKLLNQIHRNIQWTFMSSLQGIPQDAAERAERFGWLGDTGFTAEDYIYNYDMLGFWEKWLEDIQDSQRQDGNIPWISPIHARPPNLVPISSLYELWPCWQMTYPLLAWNLYQYYGDRRILEDHFTSIKRLIDFHRASARNHIISEGLGDHMEPQDAGFSLPGPTRTPSDFTSTACYYYEATLFSRMAEILGESGNAKFYKSLSLRIKQAINRHFLNTTTHQYATGSQTANALALYYELVPKEEILPIRQSLIKDITGRGGRLSTGIMGLDAVVQTLPRFGAASLMYQLATETEYPSLGYQVLKGATTVCENYECDPWVSQNMKMLGSLDKFFYRDLAGIQPAAPGYRRITIAPQPVGDLERVTASQKTVRGTVSVDWAKRDGSFYLNVTIPVGAEADIVIPMLGMGNMRVTENERTVWTNNSFIPGTSGLTSATAGTDSITVHGGSGSYRFAVSGIPLTIGQ
jgi:alpha-L-rhamnosidase